MELYIRFGDIPEDFQSKVYRNDTIIRNEGGVSVWNCIESNDMYFPILPKNPNENAVMDYFKLLFSDKPVYLVTGTPMFLTGADGEPLLMDDIKIIKELDYSVLGKNQGGIPTTNILNEEESRILLDILDDAR